MNTLTLNLKFLLKKLDITESELARRTGVGQSVIHRIASGKTENPKMDTVKSLAQYFFIRTDQLVGLEPIDENYPLKELNDKIKTIPLLTMEQIAGYPEQKIEKISLPFIHVASPDVHEKCYATQIYDLTMHPRFPEGTYFIVDPKLTAKNKDFIVFRKKDQEKASVRQLLLDNNEKYLKALNPDFRTILLTPEYNLLGTVIQTQTNYKDLSQIINVNKDTMSFVEAQEKPLSLD